MSQQVRDVAEGLRVDLLGDRRERPRHRQRREVLDWHNPIVVVQPAQRVWLNVELGPRQLLIGHRREEGHRPLSESVEAFAPKDGDRHQVGRVVATVEVDERATHFERGNVLGAHRRVHRRRRHVGGRAAPLRARLRLGAASGCRHGRRAELEPHVPLELVGERLDGAHVEA